MYPLVLIIPIGIVKKDKYLPLYVLPLAVLGWAVAFWHNLLYYGIVPESSVPCLAGISCTTKLVEWLGFITIPLLSLAAFSTIIACMAVVKNYGSKNKKS
jgi:disulfide bond formation protein DsbB